MMFWRTPPSFDKRRANLKDMPDKTFVFFEWASVLTKALPCAETDASHYTKARNSSRLSLPSAAGGKRPARERDFQVCAKPTTRIACRLKRVPSKIIHRIIFEFAPYKQSALEPLFSCKRGSNFRKYAWTDKSFSLVATSAQRRCLWTPRAFCKKLDQKLLYICHTTRLCAVGE